MLYITAGSRGESLKLSRALVIEVLAACANILEAHTVYRWKGKVEEAPETVAIVKTRNALVEKAMARVQEVHSYDVPCAVVYDMAAGLPPYLAWIDQETAGN